MTTDATCTTEKSSGSSTTEPCGAMTTNATTNSATTESHRLRLDDVTSSLVTVPPRGTLNATATSTTEQYRVKTTPVTSTLVQQWLHSIGQQQYFDAFLDNGYDDLEVCKQIGYNDLDAIGVLTSAHRVAIYNAVERLRHRVECNKPMYYLLENPNSPFRKFTENADQHKDVNENPDVVSHSIATESSHSTLSTESSNACSGQSSHSSRSRQSLQMLTSPLLPQCDVDACGKKRRDDERVSDSTSTCNGHESLHRSLHAFNSTCNHWLPHLETDACTCAFSLLLLNVRGLPAALGAMFIALNTCRPIIRLIRSFSR